MSEKGSDKMSYTNGGFTADMNGTKTEISIVEKLPEQKPKDENT